MAAAAVYKKVFLITGANSGVGFEGSLALAKQANTHMILAGRSPQRTNEAVAMVQAEASASSTVEGAIADLPCLASGRHLARGLIQRDLQFFTVVCNAGVQVKQQSFTADGFESTIGVNHIAHFLLVQLLKDRTKRIAMLSSETHDPSAGGGNPIADLMDLDAVARGTIPFTGMSIYATSKLFNLLCAKEFARRYATGPEIVADTPGFPARNGAPRRHAHGRVGLRATHRLPAQLAGWRPQQYSGLTYM